LCIVFLLFSSLLLCCRVSVVSFARGSGGFHEEQELQTELDVLAAGYLESQPSQRHHLCHDATQDRLWSTDWHQSGHWRVLGQGTAKGDFDAVVGLCGEQAGVRGFADTPAGDQFEDCMLLDSFLLFFSFSCSFAFLYLLWFFF
jgi:hypothetical protein